MIGMCSLVGLDEKKLWFHFFLKFILALIHADTTLSGDFLFSARWPAACEKKRPHFKFDLDSTHGFIQIDASNAFNSINRQILLHNVKILCPEIATYISNCYIKPARLFITGGGELSSKEGTTQGDPIAMGMYALGLMSLLTSVITSETNKLYKSHSLTTLREVGTIDELQKWWENVLYYGPYLGYHVNELKSWLITKEDHLEQARQKFKNSAIKITTEGHRHLGAVVGNQENKESYVAEKVASWVKEIDMLSNISRTQPRAAYSAFIHGYGIATPI